MYGMQCSLCHSDYDATSHRPRHLRCGHGACDGCVTELLKLKKIDCPTCRRTSKVAGHGDVPINFHALNILKEGDKYKLDSKSSLDSDDDIRNVKVKHISKVQPVILKVENNINSLHTKLSDLKIKKLKILEDQKKLLQEEEKVSDCLRNYEKDFKTICDARDKVVTSLSKLDLAKTTQEMQEKLEENFKWQQYVQIWCSINMGPNDMSDSNILADGRSIMDMLMEGQLVNIVWSIKKEEHTAALFLKNDMIHMHTFDKRSPTFGAAIIPYEQLFPQIFDPATLVYIELSYKGVVQGRVYIRLVKELPQCGNNMRLLCTGEEGTNLKGLRFNFGNDDWLRASLPSSMHISGPVRRDHDAKTHDAVEGDVVGGWMRGKPLTMLYLQHGSSFTYPTAVVFGKIKYGLSIIRTYSDMNLIDDLEVSDCGIVLEHL